MHPRRIPPSKEKLFAALLFVQFLFGMNYLFSKIILSHIPAIVWASSRGLITASCLLFYCALTKRLDIRRMLVYHRQLILFSLLGVAINQATFLMGLHYTTTTNSAILSTLIPVFTIFIVALRGQEVISPGQAIGFFFAFIGVLVMHRPESYTFSDKTFLGDLLILINAASYATYLAYSHRFFEKTDSIWATAWLFTFGSIALTLFALPEWLEYQWHPLPSTVTLSMGISILAGTLLPYALISYALAYSPSSFVALFIYVQPIVASGMSYLFLGEVIETRTLIASTLVFAGVFIAITSKTILLKKSPISANEVPSPDNVIPLKRKNYAKNKKTRRK